MSKQGENELRNVKMKEDIRKELEDIAPNLAKLNNNQQFKVPEGYFDSLPGIIQDRIISEKPVNPVFDWLKEILNVRVAVPAFVLLFAIGGAWYFDNQPAAIASSGDYLSYDYISNSVYFE
ncbi:MAG: hypothetical protein HKN22_02720, partial [Bacteroidia bacterium]|nr:hypothetical protein [Bacteroidia bacterium]